MPGSIIILVIKAVIVVITCMSLCSYFRNGKLDVVQYMVTKTNCDINAKDIYGRTPLDLAQR